METNDRDDLREALRELDATPAEIAAWTPLVRRLAEWPEGHITPADQGDLLSVLEQAIPLHSAVRQALREQKPRRVTGLLATARAQVSLFGLGFWLVSALVTLLGAAVVLGRVLPDQELVLRVSGPCLSYLGTLVAFRGRGTRVLELELVCLPSPLQLAIARLVIVLGYDVGLGLALSLALWAGGAGQVLTLTLTFLIPLLLVAGLTLLLSLRLSVQAAASLAYGSWLAFLAISTLSNLQAHLLSLSLVMLPGCIGLALLVIALLRIHASMHRLLPHL
ncbi:hypothetical protein [Ktedonobacter racemifer]|uniref:Uncharacterized protein n=1 Tax=Ktedonobacter racemifer DSM 44963 TaxID=485913 RepID=D6U1V8_KTERA|nr:hypothetical protein [Ktedonobacter racemifer]EFH80842.1 hypothetical protein Krac_1472 [Ktedonobacter racemifer DSM 44963]